MPAPVDELYATTGCYCCLLGFDFKVPRCLAATGKTTVFGCCMESYRCGCPNSLDAYRQDQCLCCDYRCGLGGETVPCMVALFGLVCCDAGHSKQQKLDKKVAKVQKQKSAREGADVNVVAVTEAEVMEREKASDAIDVIDVNDLCCKSACLCCIQGFFFKVPQCLGCSGSGGCCGCCMETYRCGCPTSLHCYSAQQMCCIDYRFGCCGGTIPRLVTCCGIPLMTVAQDPEPEPEPFSVVECPTNAEMLATCCDQIMPQIGDCIRGENNLITNSTVAVAVAVPAKK